MILNKPCIVFMMISIPSLHAADNATGFATAAHATESSAQTSFSREKRDESIVQNDSRRRRALRSARFALDERDELLRKLNQNSERGSLLKSKEKNTKYSCCWPRSRKK